MDIANLKAFIRDVEDLDELDNFINARFIRTDKCMSKSIYAPRIPKIRRKRFNPLLELGELEFKQKYRYTKENILKLIELIRDDLELDRPPCLNGSSSNQVPLEMQVMVAIRHWGLNELPELIAHIHDITTQTLGKICRRVAAAFASKASRYIRMPVTLAEKEQVTKNFYALAAFPQVIGAVSCKALRLEKPLKPDVKQREASASPLHCQCLMNIQIISDSSCKIRDFDFRLRPLLKSLSNDQQIFPETRIKERFEQHEFRGRILLGDDNYTCTNYLFTPIAISQLATKKHVLYNTAHAYTHASVKKTLQMWQQRFRIIDNEILTCASFNGAKQLLTALAVLHNIALDLNDSYADFPNDFGINEFISDTTFNEDICNARNLENNGSASRATFISKYF